MTSKNGNNSGSGWRCPRVWAKPELFEGNAVKQLLIPDGVFSSVYGVAGAMEVRNRYGRWPAFTQGDGSDVDAVRARLAIGTQPGDS